MTDTPISISEPFNSGRAAYRMLFDFGVLISSFSNSSNKRVLDLGAGTGWISELLNRMGYEVYSLDIDIGMPATIKHRILADNRIVSNRIIPILGSGMDLPFKNDYFSHICFFDTLHHMNDYQKTFFELFRVLSPGGRAIFIEPGAKHSKSEETINFINTYKKDDPTWIERDVNLDEIAQISAKCGFSDLIMQPTLLPGLKTYSISQWNEFRQGNLSIADDYLNLLFDFNYNDHLSFYCEKPKSMGANKMDAIMTKLSSPQENNDLLSGIMIAVDLTPMLPGAENGGAKLMTLELVRALAELLPQTTFHLLTSESSHAELDELEENYSNIKRMCVLHSSVISPATANIASPLLPVIELSFSQKIKDNIKAFSRRVLPFTVKQYIKHLMHRDISIIGTSNLLSQIGADMLFCPFTAPFYADGKRPLVSVIYDLQYRTYPQFFTSEELFQREEAFKNAYRHADHLVAISEFVQSTVIQASGLSKNQVSAVPIGLFRNPMEGKTKDSSFSLLSNYGLEEKQYLLFPANFWNHKNHSMLLTAFNIFKTNHPESKLKLVCTGAPGRAADNFCKVVQRMGLSDSVIYPGFVSPNEYDLLLLSSFALIFPSLYEGFGIPVLEAMAAGIPVLCSDVTSLPEVGGDAVLYFDPRKPVEICNTIERILNEPSLRALMVDKGLQRARSFEGPNRMAQEYRVVFNKVMELNKMGSDAELYGIYDDGWTSDNIKVNYLSSVTELPRSLSIIFINPSWRKSAVNIKIYFDGKTLFESRIIKVGKKIRFSIPIPKQRGSIEINISPTFNPVQMGLNLDSRDLGLRCLRFTLKSRDEKQDFLRQR